MTTLTKEEQLKSLSKGKRKHEKAAKIVLCNPFPKYWPLISEDIAETIGNLLNVLVIKEIRKPKVPWNEMKKLSNEMRKRKRKELYSKIIVPKELLEQRKCLKLGINSVSRALQNMSIQSCLLAGDVEHEIMISHLVTLACTRGVPVLIVPNLKSISSKILGFKTTAIGVKVSDEDSHFRSLNETILKLSLQFPIPPHFSWIKNRVEEHEEKKLKIAPKNKPCRISPDPELLNPASSASKNFASFADDFIPLDPKIEMITLKDAKEQIYAEYLNKIFYLAPKFKKMQKNANRCRNKKLISI